ncbi:7tm odorant receptor domain-containing protein [Phthorimaea operculella]|nr:7tm odorant receptor domain-containing protein [Phthorimaea operculella]
MTKCFEKSLKLTHIALLFSGINIYPSQNAFWNNFLYFLFYFNFLWLYTDVFGEFFWIIDGIEIGKSFGELSLIAPCTTICLLSTAKIVPAFYHRQIIPKVIEKLKHIHPKFNENDDKCEVGEFNYIEEETLKISESEVIERKIVKDATRFLSFVIHLLYYSSAVVVVLFTTIPLMNMAFDYYKTGEWKLDLPFFTKYFFDPFTRVTWPLVYLHQTWSTFIAAFNVFGVDTFLYAFCTYMHMHFSILCHRFEHVVSDSVVETRQRLKQLIKRHQELIELVNQVELMSSKSTLFNIITSSVLICLSAFNVTFMDDSATIIAFLTFLAMSLSQISLLCLFGDLLMRSSTKISEGIYKCRWYDTDPGVKRSIFLILIRAQKPCRLTAADFADLNLTAFTTILSRSWSYFALLRTVYK